MTQPELVWVTDTHVTEPSEQRRLSRQNAAVLARLRRGRATRRELTDIALNVTARVSDLRKHLRPRGESVEVIEEHQNGLTVYAIVSWPR